MVNESQPNTQEIGESGYSALELEETEEADVPVWGRLYPVREKFPPLGLSDKEYEIGRAQGCAVVLSENLVKANILVTISKKHFKIVKEEVSSALSAVYIEDLSINGTFINGELLGKGKRRVLRNNDQISISLPKFKVYIYVDATCDTESYPEEIKMKYVVSRELGSGAYGKVHLIFDKASCQRYAMKIVSKKHFNGDGQNGFNDPNTINNEVSILKALDHACIIKIKDVLDTADAVYIVLELMEGGDLLDCIQKSQRLAEPVAKLIFYQIVQAVKYLHSNGIIHRDLKPDNILLSTDDPHTLVKVSDFGLSKFVDSQSMLKTFCGTPIYVAPEILKFHGAGAYTMQVDIWSMGVILFVCLGGYTPFNNERKLPLKEQILKGVYFFPDAVWKNVSVDAISLIKQMLTVDPEKRIKIDDILRHKWLQDKSVVKQAKKLMKTKTDSENMAPPSSPTSKRARLGSDVTFEN